LAGLVSTDGRTQCGAALTVLIAAFVAFIIVNGRMLLPVDPVLAVAQLVFAMALHPTPLPVRLRTGFTRTEP
jgi:hypothetical protein